MPMEIVRYMLDFNTEDYIKEVNSRLTNTMMERVKTCYSKEFDAQIPNFQASNFRRIYLNNICSISSEFSHRGPWIEFICFCIAYPNKEGFELFDYFCRRFRSNFTDYCNYGCAESVYNRNLHSFMYNSHNLYRHIKLTSLDMEGEFNIRFLKRLVYNSIEKEKKTKEFNKNSFLYLLCDMKHSHLELCNRNLRYLDEIKDFALDMIRDIDEEWYFYYISHVEKAINAKYFVDFKL